MCYLIKICSLFIKRLSIYINLYIYVSISVYDFSGMASQHFYYSLDSNKCDYITNSTIV